MIVVSHRQFAWLLSLVIVLTALPFEAAAQQRSKRGKAQSSQHKKRQHDAQDRKKRGGTQAGPRRTDRSQGHDRRTDRSSRRGPPPAMLNPFEPTPADRGPLAPGEERELLRFAKRRVPFAYRMLNRARRENPAAFAEHLERAAPRLRQLRRLFDSDPAQARRLVRYTADTQQLNHLRAKFRQNRDRPGAARRVANEARPLIADRLKIEREVLRAHVETLDEQRDQMIDAEMRRLMDPMTDLADKPPPLRMLLGRLRESDNPAQRKQLENRLRLMCTTHIERRIAHLRERQARISETPLADQVDQQLRRFLQSGAAQTPFAAPRRDDKP